MSPRTGTILIVEDNEDNRIVYAAMLEHIGCRVLEATNGEEGIARARADRPDVILMDIALPGIDGYEATRILKRDPGTRHIPIIAVTAHAHDIDRRMALAAGCDEYVAKPATPRDVADVVQRWLEPAGGNAARRLSPDR